MGTDRDGPATRLHAREMMTTFRDPGVRAGPLRILPRTSCHWMVLDERRPMGDQVVFVAQNQSLRIGSEGWKEALFALKAMAETEGLAIEGVSDSEFRT